MQQRWVPAFRCTTGAWDAPFIVSPQRAQGARCFVFPQWLGVADFTVARGAPQWHELSCFSLKRHEAPPFFASPQCHSISFYRSGEAINLLFNQIGGAPIDFTTSPRCAHSFVSPLRPFFTAARAGAPTLLFHPSRAGRPLFRFTPAARCAHSFLSPQRRGASTALFRHSGSGRRLICFKAARGVQSFV